MNTLIGEITEGIPVLHQDMLSREVDVLFKHHPHLEGSVILHEQRPIGLIMKAAFYQKIAGKYGFDVFMGRPIQLLMKRDPLVVDEGVPIVNVSRMAMKREQDHLYDYVVVTKNSIFKGIVSIRTLLIKFAEIQTELARTTNPLTGLPGNITIEEKLRLILTKPSYSILYIDLDRFKAFNDGYGFQQGDRLIQMTASVLQNHIGKQQGFIGHIGGDDFLGIINHDRFEKVCKNIIRDFDLIVPSFYNEEDSRSGFVIGTNRDGRIEKIPLVSISIAVITQKGDTYRTIEEISEAAARMKKICKKEQTSCFAVDTHYQKEKPACC